MSLPEAIARLKHVLRTSHFDIVSISESRLELRGHNRNNLAILPTLVYGVLPIVGVFYFWNKKGAEGIAGLCALLFTAVLVGRIMSIYNTQRTFVLYDHSSGQLSFRNSEKKILGVRTSDIERIESSLTIMVTYIKRYPFKREWYIANVDLFNPEGIKYTVSEFEAETPYAPTEQAQALGQLLAAYLTRPYTHSEEVTVL